MKFTQIYKESNYQVLSMDFLEHQRFWIQKELAVFH